MAHHMGARTRLVDPDVLVPGSGPPLVMTDSGDTESVL